VQHAHHISAEFPWRTATVVVGALAAVELFALIAIGAAQLAPHKHTAATASRSTAARSAPAHRAAPHFTKAPQHRLQPRGRVEVLVLNGNGVSGAAGAAADRLRVEGYRIGGATNAPRHDYARSMIMFVPGWLKEARRLAHDTGVRLVAPIDGLRRSQLRGSKIVLLLGT
jgi:LytR cell envelope-related transcriptional attenuator